MNSQLPFSQACENNKQPILNILKPLFNKGDTVLEIGSGTGQHANFFAEQMPTINWQPSDREMNLQYIQAWQQAKPLVNNLPPLTLDIDEAWPTINTNHVFTANTLHIISFSQVETLFTKVAELLNKKNLFIIYGPFNYDGAYTSESNEGFDEFLKSRDPLSGIRDFESIVALAEGLSLIFKKDHAMPANNRCLVFEKK